MALADRYVGTNGSGALSVTPARSRVRRMGLRLLALLLLAGVIGAGAVYYWLRPIPVAVVNPRIGPAIVAVYASGTVEPAIMLPVAPRVGARLVSLHADEQAAVVKGQVLAGLESADLNGNIAQLQAQADFARNDLARYQRLMQENAVAAQTYERARATSEGADAAVRQARAQAGFMTLAAPGNCTVIQRDGEIGQFIAANTPIFWLSCHAALRISAQVDEEDIPLVRKGQKVLVRADAFPGRVFDAVVSEVTPKGDPVGRSYRVRIGLPENSPLRIGMTTEANIVVQTRPHALLLPAAAVTDGAVWKMAQGRARRVPVGEGVKSGDWIEITRGVAAGEQIVADGREPARGRTLKPVPVSP